MSDEREQTLRELMEELSGYSGAVAVTLEALPVPIKLPGSESEDTDLAREMLPAVIRAFEILNEQPLPKEQQTWAAAALLHWITAAESVLIYALRGTRYKAEAAVLNIVLGEAVLADLFEWLDKQDGTA
ncbi:hypothetical protein [Streptomyces halobius]|uniref:Uncharacterized protein n=1 Tax=Streptomyces halobius TaxID=2879846 RepID=A0ABY4ME96_9ACTN|nr:hypothetical protein [Streptomyces halobius]UQA95642.1 hypothetical protein K9S39_30640 [Streptomyces halobius]